MVTININMEIRPAKRQEMLQTLQELTAAMRQSPGFLHAEIGMRNGKPNALTFTAQWATPQAVTTYLHSEYFRVLEGALAVLARSAAIEFTPECGQFKQCSIYFAGVKGGEQGHARTQVQQV